MRQKAGQLVGPVIALFMAVGCAEVDPNGQLLLAIKLAGEGTVTSSPGAVFCRGESAGGASGICETELPGSRLPVTLKAEAAPGWRFGSWSVEGAQIPSLLDSSARAQSIHVDGIASQLWTAHFEELPKPDAGSAANDGGETDGGEEQMDAGFVITAVDTGAGTDLTDVAYFPNTASPPGFYLAVGAGGVTARSADGLAWSIATIPDATGTVGSVAASDSQLVYVDGTATIHHSSDATTWTPVTPTGTDTFRIVSHLNGVFLAVGADDASAPVIFSSPDGATWTKTGYSDPTPVVHLSYMFGKYNGLGSSGTIVQSADLTSWTTLTTPSTGLARDLRAVVFAKDLAVLVTADITGTGSRVAFSSDGSRYSPNMSFVPGTVFRDVGYHPGRGLFVAVGTKGKHFTSADGVEWVVGPTTLSSTTGIQAIETAGPATIVVGSGGYAGVGPP